MLPLVLLGTPIPTDDELEKARPDVEELTKADYQALRAGVQTHAGLAANLAGYAAQGDVDEAARYLLLRASFRQYAVGEDINCAVRAYDAMKRRHGVAYALSIARFSAAQLNRSASLHAPGAKDFVERLAAEERREKSIDNLRLQMADVIRFEREYPRTGLTHATTADIAEFWWREAEAARTPESASTLRARAAEWYALAVTNGVLRGVRRQIAEKRILQTRRGEGAVAQP